MQVLPVLYTQRWIAMTISLALNAQKVAASTLFLCLYRYSNSAAHEDCPR